MLAGVVDRLAEQLRSPAREVVVGRSPWRAAVLENVRDRGGVGTTLPDQQRGRDDHPLAWASHSQLLGSGVCMMLYIIAGGQKLPPREDAKSPNSERNGRFCV